MPTALINSLPFVPVGSQRLLHQPNLHCRLLGFPQTNHFLSCAGRHAGATPLTEPALPVARVPDRADFRYETHREAGKSSDPPMYNALPARQARRSQAALDGTTQPSGLPKLNPSDLGLPEVDLPLVGPDLL